MCDVWSPSPTNLCANHLQTNWIVSSFIRFVCLIGWLEQSTGFPSNSRFFAPTLSPTLMVSPFWRKSGNSDCVIWESPPFVGISPSFFFSFLTYWLIVFVCLCNIRMSLFLSNFLSHHQLLYLCHRPRMLFLHQNPLSGGEKSQIGEEENWVEFGIVSKFRYGSATHTTHNKISFIDNETKAVNTSIESQQYRDISSFLSRL